MKFFKFDLKGYNDGGYFFETHYIDVEEIKEIIVSSSIGNNEFTLKTRDGSLFFIKNDYLGSLLKLLNIDEKEDKK